MQMYRTMVLIRVAEETLLRLFSQNRMPGFIHSYIGEEATAVGVCAALRPDDYITSHHRGHGHILAKGGDLKRFFAELYGKADGYCKGKGGSMHVADLDLGIFGANGIVGAGIPIAAGAALAAQLEGSDRVAVAFTGDGATDIGAFHESLQPRGAVEPPDDLRGREQRLRGLHRREDHQKIDQISDRAAAYGMPGVTVDGNDVAAVYVAAKGSSRPRAIGRRADLDEARDVPLARTLRRRPAAVPDPGRGRGVEAAGPAEEPPRPYFAERGRLTTNAQSSPSVGDTRQCRMPQRWSSLRAAAEPTARGGARGHLYGHRGGGVVSGGRR